MNLVIVESPTKARTLSKFLGKDYQVESSMGHIRDLPKSKLGVDVDKDFKPAYVLSKDKGKVVKVLQDASLKAKTVYLAMDPDREGEAIAYHVRHVIRNQKSNSKYQKADFFKRVTFHEITKSAIEEALSHPGSIDTKLVNAQQARRIIDRLAGYTLSPVLWKKVRRGLSAGRVQSVALRLIVEREEEINAFKPTKYWEIRVQLMNSGKENLWVELIAINGKKAPKDSFLITTSDQSKDLEKNLITAEYSVTSIKRIERVSRPYPPFTTSTLQQAAATVFGWTANTTMSTAQKLYELGHITYHRTDSVTLSSSAISAARDYIKSNHAPEYLPDSARLYKTTSKNAQEAHEAIRPTQIGSKEITTSKGMTDRHQKLYQLIWRRTVASQMADAVYDATTIDVIGEKKETSNKIQEYGLRATGSIMKFPGWRVLFKHQKDDTVLPALTESEKLNYIKHQSEAKETLPPPRYNDASLVKALEQRGIGRPSTYAPIIGTIINRGYVEREERRFFATAVGMAVIEFLKSNFDGIIDYDFTAEMEEDLDRIARGEKDWTPVIKSWWGPFEIKAKAVEENAKRVKIAVEKLNRKCPTCKEGELVVRSGRFGKFISCDRFPDCKHTEPLVQKVKGIKCEKCKKGSVVIKKTRKGRTFYGCSRYPKCDWASWTKPNLPGQKPNKKSKNSKSN